MKAGKARPLHLVAVLVAGLLSACNAPDPTMGVAATPSAPATAAAPVAQGGAAKLYVAPIIGSTIAAVTPLSRRLTEVAPVNGVELVGETDPARTNVIKGYFSAFAETGSTTVVYVWDVFDASGNRVHRIQGQEVQPGIAADDPWAVVTPDTMARIADRTLADFNAWRATTS